jgi:hypothetical protein
LRDGRKLDAGRSTSEQIAIEQERQNFRLPHQQSLLLQHLLFHQKHLRSFSPISTLPQSELSPFIILHYSASQTKAIKILKQPPASRILLPTHANVNTKEIIPLFCAEKGIFN